MFIVVYKPDYKYFQEYIASWKSPNDYILLFSQEDDFKPIFLKVRGEYVFVNTFNTDLMLSCHSHGNSVSILNTEQLTRVWYIQKYKSDILRLLLNDVTPTIYDYSSVNSNLTPFNLKVERIIPYRADPTEIPDYKINVEYDVAFLGTMSDRRGKILNELEERGVKVREIKAWGEERDAQVQSCKVIINIHYDEDYKIYESIRCDRWLAFGKVVVSEDSLETPTDPNLIISSYDDLVKTVISSILLKSLM